MLDVRNLRKTYQSSTGPVAACDGLDFEVERGEILSLVGPSGCGKTSALRCVAGLETPDSGVISINADPLFDDAKRIDRPAQRRPIGMVFQSYAIWPHMTVGQNVAYPLTVGPRRSRPSKTEVAEMVKTALERVRIPELADRPASALSGGQQQRVAIARALLRGADLLLFDEPLSNLDAKLREEMRGELRAMFEHAEVGVLYVTHDLAEALALSDRLLVLHSGRIVQSGVPEEIYSRPKTDFVASFLGNANLVPGEIVTRGHKTACVVSQLGRFEIDTTDFDMTNDRLTLLIRPDALEALHPDDGHSWMPTASVEASMFLGSSIEYRLRLGDHAIRVCMPASVARFEVDSLVKIAVSPELVIPIASDERSPSIESAQHEPELEPVGVVA